MKLKYEDVKDKIKITALSKEDYERNEYRIIIPGRISHNSYNTIRHVYLNESDEVIELNINKPYNEYQKIKTTSSVNNSNLLIVPVIESKELIEILCANGSPSRVNFGKYPMSSTKNLDYIREKDNYQLGDFAFFDKTGRTYSFGLDCEKNEEYKYYSNLFIPFRTSFYAVEDLVWIVDYNNNKLICASAITDRVDTNDYSNVSKFLEDQFFSDITQDLNSQKVLSELLKEEKNTIMLYNPFELTNKKLSAYDRVMNALFNTNTVIVVGPKIEIENSMTIDFYDQNTIRSFENIVIEAQNRGINTICIMNADGAFNKGELGYYFKNKVISHIINNRILNVYQGPFNIKFVLYTNDNMKECLNEFSESEVIYNLFEYAIYYDVHPLLCSLIHMVSDEKCMKHTSHMIDWIAASRLLYETENIDSLIDLLGKDLVDILNKIAYNNIIAITDVINRDYNPNIIKHFTKEQKYLQVSYLSLIDEKNLEVVRNFIIMMDSSLLELFDALWSRGHENKKKIVEELSATNNMILKK